MSHTVKIRILDKVYEVACTPGKEDYVEDLGKQLNEKVHVISGVVEGQTIEQHILVTALFLLEDLKNTRNGNPQKSSTVSENASSELEDALAVTADRIDAICARLESLQLS